MTKAVLKIIDLRKIVEVLERHVVIHRRHIRLAYLCSIWKTVLDDCSKRMVDKEISDLNRLALSPKDRAINIDTLMVNTILQMQLDGHFVIDEVAIPVVIPENDDAEGTNMIKLVDWWKGDQYQSFENLTEIYYGEL